MTGATSTLKPDFRPGGGHQQYSQQSPWPQYTWFFRQPLDTTIVSLSYHTTEPANGHSWSTRPQHPSPQQHALYTAAPYYMYGQLMTPTDLDMTFNTMHLNPSDNTWYMDTGSTSHVANNEVFFTAYYSMRDVEQPMMTEEEWNLFNQEPNYNYQGANQWWNNNMNYNYAQRQDPPELYTHNYTNPLRDDFPDQRARLEPTQPEQQKSRLENLLEIFMAQDEEHSKIDEEMQESVRISQALAKNREKDMERITHMLSERSPGGLPQVDVVTTQSGNLVNSPPINTNDFIDVQDDEEEETQELLDWWCVYVSGSKEEEHVHTLLIILAFMMNPLMIVS